MSGLRDMHSREECRVALVRINVSEEHIASIIRVTRIGELEKTLAVTSNRRTRRSISYHPDDGRDMFSETSVLTRATWRRIPEDGILHSHRSENLQFYICTPFITRFP
jgi:hypothetical protein